MTINLTGSSDSAECYRRVRDLLDPDQCRRTFKSNDCFSSPTAHSTDTNYVAVSGFYYVMSYLELLNTKPSIEDFRTAIKHRCNMTWDEITKSQPEVPVQYASVVCFEAQYIELLLLEGYGIKEGTWKNIDFLKKVNGTSVGWTLGFTIQSTNAFPEESAIEPFSAIMFISVMFLLAFGIGVCLTLLISMMVKKNCSKIVQ